MSLLHIHFIRYNRSIQIWWYISHFHILERTWTKCLSPSSLQCPWNR